MKSKCLIHYAQQSPELDGQYLFFTNPHIPYSPELRTNRSHAHACLFTVLLHVVLGYDQIAAEKVGCYQRRRQH